MRSSCGGTLRPPLKAQDRQRARRVPAPARARTSARQQRLGQRVLDARRLDELEDDLERKRVLVGQREDEAVVGRRGLQFEIERAAELLAQREAPRAIDARAEGRVQDQLHAAAFVEEALGDDRVVGRHDAEDRLARRARTRRPARRRRDPARTRARATRTRRGVVALVDRGAHARRPRARARSCGPSPSPFQNGIDGGAPCASSTRTTPGFDAPDLPRVRAQQEDVAGHALDREVFVERADDVALGLDDDVVVRGLGNRAAARDRRHARAAARAHACR